MEDIYFPDYQGGSIVNLMSSIALACKGKTQYNPLKILSPQELARYKNIVLVVVDALGYEYLKEKQNSFLFKNMRGTMASVALPTTACAITTFLTGLPPQQTAVTGWHMHLKELGAVTTILPFVPRVKGKFNEDKIKIEQILDEKGIFQKIKRKSFILTPEELKSSQYNKLLCKKAKTYFFNKNKGFFKELEKIIKLPNRKYIYAYWPDFDMLCHKYGKENKKVEIHFNQLDKKFKELYEKVKRTDTIIIVTADHGSTSLPLKERTILENHPKLKECLSLPLCGDSRTKYCYVHPSKAQQFEDYIKNNLNNICECYKTQELIDKNLFGLGKPNEKLFDRLGDYILVMKGNNMIKDYVIGETDNKHIGHHGGLSKEEMLVPLVILK